MTMQRRLAGDLPYYTFESFPNGRLVHAVFGRHGGVSPAPFNSLNMSVTVGDSLDNVRENRRRALRAVNLPEDDFADTWLVHGTRTLVATTNRHVKTTPPEQADALVTNVSGVNLFMRYADCVPIFLYDPVQHAIGLAHSGWRGTVNGSTQSAVQTMVSAFGSRPADILAGIGPSISVARYAVGAEVVQAARAAFPQHPEVIVETDGQPHFDLWAANRIALEQVGVRQIELSGWCTATHTDHFFSHRGDRGQSGRFGAVIALRP